MFVRKSGRILSSTMLLFALLNLTFCLGESITIGNDTSSYAEAKNNCAKLHSSSRLFDVSNVDEMKHVINRMTMGEADSVWLSLTKSTLDSHLWVDGSRADQSIFVQNMTLSEPCGMVDLEQNIHSFLPCHHAGSSFICQYTGCMACHSIYKTSHNCIAQGGVCYTFNLRSANWYHARETCRSEGGDLAIIRNSSFISNFKHFWNKNVDASCKESWIGLHRETWENEDKGIPSSSLWEKDEPNGARNCSIMTMANGEMVWRAVWCHEKHRFYCIQNNTFTTDMPMARSCPQVSWCDVLQHINPLLIIWLWFIGYNFYYLAFVKMSSFADFVRVDPLAYTELIKMLENESSQ